MTPSVHISLKVRDSTRTPKQERCRTSESESAPSTRSSVGRWT
jgi:hypothetical protein